MKYLTTDEGFYYLEKNGWINQQMKEWMETEKFKFVDNFDKRVTEYLDSSSSENNKYDYRYISFHSETDPAFAQSPIYINSLLRLPWNILLTLVTSREKCKIF